MGFDAAWYVGKRLYGIMSDSINVSTILIAEGPKEAASEIVYRASNGLGKMAWDAASSGADYLAQAPDYILNTFVTDRQPANYWYQQAEAFTAAAANQGEAINEFATKLIIGKDSTCPIDGSTPFSAAQLIAPTFVFLTSTHYLAKSCLTVAEKVANLLTFKRIKSYEYCLDDKCENKGVRGERMTTGGLLIDVAKGSASIILLGALSTTAANGMVRHLPEEIKQSARIVFASTAAAIFTVDLIKSLINSSSVPKKEMTSAEPSEAKKACCKDCEKTGGSCRENNKYTVITPNAAHAA